ncbi:zinc finger MYM-type protein 6-like [Bombina bombina]|uniref:zinc finger MYM-type protein 6-like n=1 Tax=Bombina bombina TaxID=8345 RepID=UPI00235AFE82|nr:zinc finger MYM-type protein 6-like [Bombina bombina]
MGSVDFFIRKKEALHSEKRVLVQASTTDKSLLMSSYLVAKRIATCKKPYSDGENLIKPCLIDVASTVFGQSAADKLKQIPLSNDTIARRVCDMSANVEAQLIEKLKKSIWLSLQLDESTDIADNSVLIAYVRYADYDMGDVAEDILCVCTLQTYTTSSEIFRILNDYIENAGLQWKYCVGLCTDGAANITGRHSGVGAKIKEVSHPNIMLTHCFIHKEHLASKKLSPELNDVLTQATTLVNYIKNSALNSRLLAVLCEEMGSDYQHLLYHTEVRWLSRGRVLKRLFEMRKEVEVFLLSRKHEMAGLFKDEEWVARLAYLSDIFSKINELNLGLQGEMTNIFTAAEKVEGFKKKLSLWVEMIERNNFEMFAAFSEFHQEDTGFDLEVVKKHIKEHLEALLKAFQSYFPEEKDPRKENMWIVNPFIGHDNSLPYEAKETLLELSCDKQLEKDFQNKSLTKFWMKVKEEYKHLHEIAIKFLLCFATTYLCETGFSAMTLLKTKQRNRLHLQDCLRLAVTNLKPQLDKLIKEKCQQKSH